MYSKHTIYKNNIRINFLLDYFCDLCCNCYLNFYDCVWNKEILKNQEKHEKKLNLCNIL